MADNNIKNSYLDFEGLKKYNSNIKNYISKELLGTKAELSIDISENEYLINNEIERAQNVEAILTDNLRDEAARAEKAELDLDTKIDSETDKLSKIIDDNKTELQANIDKEEASRIAEIERVETKHTGDLQALDNSLQSFTREQITTLYNNLTSDYQTADESIRVDLRAEVLARENKNGLQDAQIETLNSKIEGYNINLNEKIDTHVSDYAALNEKVLAHIDTVKGNPHNVTLAELNATSKDDHDLLKNRVLNLETNTIKSTPEASITSQTIRSGLEVYGNLNIGGKLTFDGEAQKINTQTLQVKDNFIVVNSDNDTLGSALSGLAIQTGPENSPYLIAYDKTNNSVSLGIGSESNGTFAFKDINESNPILTRDKSNNLNNGNLFVWDANKNIAIDSGYNKDIFKTFVTNTSQEEFKEEIDSKFNSINEGIEDVKNKVEAIPTDEQDNLNTNVKSILGGINEVHDQLEAHELNKGNPHNVTWGQINLDALNDNINPYMDSSTAQIGTSIKVARADHIHPTDTSRAPINHASASNIYGQATSDIFGHVKVDAEISSESINPVQNKVVRSYIDAETKRAKEAEETLDTKLDTEISLARKNEENIAKTTTAKFDDLGTQINNLNNIINSLDYSKDLDPNHTIKGLHQINGKIEIESQKIQIDIDQVTGLTTEIADVKSSFATQVAYLAEELRDADALLDEAISGNTQFIKNVEDNTQFLYLLNKKSKEINDDIKNDETNNLTQQKFVLSFSKDEITGNYLPELSPLNYNHNIDAGTLV